MKRYVVFKMTTEDKAGVSSVTFTALRNPGDVKEVMGLEAESKQQAAVAAADLFAKLGIRTHTRRGDPDITTADYPDYFVAEVEKNYVDDESTRFRVYEFEPVGHA